MHWPAGLVRGICLRSRSLNRFCPPGTVEHRPQGEQYYYYGSSKNEVKRSLYIGDTLYTLSTAKILANPLDQINRTVATVVLDGKEDVLYPPMRYME